MSEIIKLRVIYVNQVNRLCLMKAKQGESHLHASLRRLFITASNDNQDNKKCMKIMKNLFGGCQNYEEHLSTQKFVHPSVKFTFLKVD